MRVKHIIQFLFLAPILALSVSCEDINAGGKPHENPEIEVTFATKISGYDSNSAEEWSGAETIGLFMKKVGTTDFSSENIVNNVVNNKFIALADGTLEPADDDQRFVFQQDGGKVDFVAYWPYKEQLPAHEISIDVSDQSATNGFNMLYSNNATGKYKGKNAVKLTFTHVVSKIAMNITNGVGVEADDLAALQITVRGMNTTGKLSLPDGAVTYTGNVSDMDIAIYEEGTKAEVYLLPTVTTPASGRMFVFNTPEAEHTYRLDTKLKFEMGKKYTFNITVSKPGLEVELSEIEDWNVIAESGDGSYQ